MRTPIRWRWLGAIAALAWAGEAAAQQPVASLDQLDSLRNSRATVTVTDTGGRQFRGTVERASPTQLSLRTGGETRQFGVADVRTVRVRREDSLINGALIGAAVGGGLTSLYFLDNECHDDPACYGAVAAYAGIGALTGLGIDALRHRSVVVYTAPASGTARRVVVAPVLGRGRTGLRMTIAF